MAHRALITGISGFVGGFLAEHLSACGDAVLGAAPNGDWLPDSPAELRDRVEIVAWDVGRDDGLSAEGRARIADFAPTCVYHLAAVSVPRDCGDAGEPAPIAKAINVEGTRRVVETAVDLPTRPRVLAVSSSHVYAPVRRNAQRVTESSPLGSRWGYGQSKLQAEEAVRRAVWERQADAIIVRAFQHTGPRQNARMMLPQWVRQFVEDDSAPIEVYTRDAWIDLTDVRDVVRAYRLLVEHGERGEVYNVGSGAPRRTGDVLEILHQMAGPHRRILELYPGVKFDPIADTARLAARTGWRPEIPLRQTVADTLAWWRAKSG